MHHRDVPRSARAAPLVELLGRHRRAVRQHDILDDSDRRVICRCLQRRQGGLFEVDVGRCEEQVRKSTSTDVTNPRGYVRHVTFNTDGYTLADTWAVGADEQLTVSLVRPVRNNFISTSIDNSLHETEHSYCRTGTSGNT